MFNRIKAAIGSVIRALAKAIVREQGLQELNLFHQLQKIGTQETIEYIEKNLPDAIALRDSEELFRYAAPKLNKDGLILEFGVFRGRTINKLAIHVSPRKIYGFDSFEGLPEDWTGWKHPAGYYDVKGNIPAVKSNVELIHGWFDQSLPKFLDGHPNQSVDFIHIHCDLYSSTKCVFEHIGPRIRKNTYIVFHEYFGFHGWKRHEFKAFQEWVDANNIKYKYLAYSSGEAGQVLIRIDSV